MVQPKMPNQNWELRFEIEFLEFDGCLDHEEFVGWLSQVEEIFACYDIPESKKVKLAATDLRGKGRSWWEKLKIQRLREGEKQDSNLGEAETETQEAIFSVQPHPNPLQQLAHLLDKFKCSK